jgi:hypothetical protein
MTLIDERRPHFEDHNYFFQALLGVVSLGDRFDEVLRDHGTSPFPTPIAIEEVSEDEFLCAMLGLVALRRRLLELVESAARTQRSHDAPAPQRRNGTASILR